MKYLKPGSDILEDSPQFEISSARYVKLFTIKPGILN